MFFSWETTPLRLLFWACWPAIWLFVCAGLFGKEPTPIGYVIMPGMTACLAFVSAACVKRHPTLALVGSITLVAPFLLLMILALIVNFAEAGWR